MTCETFIERIPEFLSPHGAAAMTNEVQQHLSGCASCRAEVDAYRHTLRALKEFHSPVISSSTERSLFLIGAALADQMPQAAPVEPKKPERARSSRPWGETLFRPRRWNWAAQFAMGILLGSLSGIWATQSWWDTKDNTNNSLKLIGGIQAGINLPISSGTITPLRPNPSQAPSPAPAARPEDRLWVADVAYVRLQDQLQEIFKDYPGVHFYLDPDLKEARISPLEVKEGIPFEQMLQQLAHASDLMILQSKPGKVYVFRSQGAMMYKRGNTYFFVPVQEGMAPIYRDLYRMKQTDQ